MRKSTVRAGAKVKALLLDADYVMENGIPVVRLWCKLPNGKNLVAFDRKFEPYFYVEPKSIPKRDIEELRQRIRNLELEGKKPTKVETLEKKYLGL
ncbi:MAG: hypothetical protein MUP55_03380, partial [Candidatus Aenigmarchaeota archaeon]|nr:hypothetical protein [Candidatus Aenigmarchaeota archaeon]